MASIAATTTGWLTKLNWQERNCGGIEGLGDLGLCRGRCSGDVYGGALSPATAAHMAVVARWTIYIFYLHWKTVANRNEWRIYVFLCCLSNVTGIGGELGQNQSTNKPKLVSTKSRLKG